MSNILKTFMLSAVAFMLLSCEDLMNYFPELSDRVTLTLETSMTKTLLHDEKYVLWQDGDRICINGMMYNIIVDSLDSSTARIENVVKADKYYASYAYSYHMEMDDYVITGGYLWPYQTYVKDGFGQYMNPMVGFSTTSSITMHNMGSILKVGVQGQYDIKHLSVSVQGVIAGHLKIFVENVQNGIYDINMNDFYNSTVSMDFAGSTVSTDGLKYFYFIVAPGEFPNGMVVSMVDADDRVYIQNTFNTMTFERASIKQMEEFAFKEAMPLTVQTTEVASDMVEYQISGEPGAVVSAKIMTKKDYQCYKDNNRLDSLFINLSEIGGGERIKMDGNLNRVANSLEGDTEYVIAARYCDGHKGFGNICIVEFTTGMSEPDPDPQPGLDYISWKTDPSFDSPGVYLSLAPNVTRVRYTFMKSMIYMQKVLMGKNDYDILNERHRLVSSSIMDAAKIEPTFMSLLNVSYSVDDDYVFIFEATLDDGTVVMGTDLARFDRTKYDDYSWKTISKNAIVEAVGIDNFVLPNVHVDKAQGEEIYRIEFFEVEPLLFFNEYGYEFYSTFMGNIKLVIDATDRNSLKIVYPYTYLMSARVDQDGYLYPIYVSPTTTKQGTGTFDGSVFNFDGLKLVEEHESGQFSTIVRLNSFSINLNTTNVSGGVQTESFVKEATKTSW